MTTSSNLGKVFLLNSRKGIFYIHSGHDDGRGLNVYYCCVDGEHLKEQYEYSIYLCEHAHSIQQRS